MDFQKRLLADLIHASYNPRKKLTVDDVEYQKISRSIDEFGYIDPIIINSDNTIIGGHQRASVLLDKGFTEVDVVVLNIEKDKEKALNIALNKISGEWDMAKLEELLSELHDSNYDITLTGFAMKEFEDIVLEYGQDDCSADDDFDSQGEYENIVEPLTYPGDIWTIGKHRIMCGDSCNPDHVSLLMNGKSAQLCVTDPPYNVNYGDKASMLDKYEKGHGNTCKIINDNLPDNEFYNFLFSAFKNMNDIACPGAAIYVFHADSEGLNFRNAFKNSGFLLKQCLIWVKNSLVLGRQDYQWRHEPILYGWKDGAAHFFVEDRSQTTVIDYTSRPEFSKMKKDELVEFITKYLDEQDNIPQSIIRCDKPTKNDEHPTMKPVPLIGKLVFNSSKPGWKVADFFGGSGSTLIACEQLQRIAYIMEMDPKYVDVIIKRYIRSFGNCGIICQRSGKKYSLDELDTDGTFSVNV